MADLQRAFDGEDWRAHYSKTRDSRPQNWREQLALRLTSRREAIATIEKDAAAAIEKLRFVYWPLDIRWDAPEIQRTVFSATRERTQLDLLLLRFALCAYRQENGVYPQFLGALNGDLLQELPRDRFSRGEPYNYSVAGEDYCLWSVGPDGEDGGGTPISFAHAPQRGLPWNKYLAPVRADSKGDYVAGENQ